MRSWLSSGVRCRPTCGSVPVELACSRGEIRRSLNQEAFTVGLSGERATSNHFENARLLSGASKVVKGCLPTAAEVAKRDGAVVHW